MTNLKESSPPVVWKVMSSEEERACFSDADGVRLYIAHLREWRDYCADAGEAERERVEQIQYLIDLNTSRLAALSGVALH